eukprot:scaffold305754_cov18-Tisochrysis_lutea.AAC.1
MAQCMESANAIGVLRCSCATLVWKQTRLCLLPQALLFPLLLCFCNSGASSRQGSFSFAPGSLAATAGQSLSRSSGSGTLGSMMHRGDAITAAAAAAPAVRRSSGSRGSAELLAELRGVQVCGRDAVKVRVLAGGSVKRGRQEVCALAWKMCVEGAVGFLTMVWRYEGMNEGVHAPRKCLVSSNSTPDQDVQQASTFCR